MSHEKRRCSRISSEFMLDESRMSSSKLLQISPGEGRSPTSDVRRIQEVSHGFIDSHRLENCTEVQIVEEVPDSIDCLDSPRASSGQDNDSSVNGTLIQQPQHPQVLVVDDEPMNIEVMQAMLE